MLVALSSKESITDHPFAELAYKNFSVNRIYGHFRGDRKIVLKKCMSLEPEAEAKIWLA